MTAAAAEPPAPPPAATATLDLPRLVRLLLFALLAVVVLRHAWVNDDAYITFRTVDQWVHGHGLRWNVAERVQAYTHPLWMLVFAALYAVTRETFYTALALSLAISGVAAWLVAFRHARSATHGALVLAALLSSLAFVDYSTSGLENPLTHLLLGLFLAVYLGDDRTPRAFLRLGLLGCAATLCRMDLFLVVLPALVEAAWAARSWRHTRALLYGFAPLVAWELFSIVYYGFPFPNTAYAKLGTHIPTGELLEQGLMYYVSTLDQDPTTLWLLGLGLATVALARRRRELAVAAGVALYLLYLLRIGGDFMLGRFLSAPLYVAMVLVARCAALPATALGLVPAGVVLALGAALQFPTLRADGNYPKQREREGWKDPRGVADERAFYHDSNGLLGATREPKMPTRHRFAQDGLRAKGSRSKVGLFYAVGMSGFFAGRDKHVVDMYALVDPLLARLPSLEQRDWRIGHFERHIPDGYLETLATGDNRIVDERLRRYYDDLARVVRGPVWSGERFAAMWRLNTGADDALIDVARYREPGVRTVARSKMAASEPVGRPPSSLLVNLEGAHAEPRLALRVDGAAAVRVSFQKAGVDLASVTVEPGEATVTVPEPARAEGYDQLRVVVERGEGRAAIGALRLLADAPR